MTISVYSHTHGVTNNGGASWTVGFPSANTGDLLICATSANTTSNGVPTAGLATDNLGGTWTAQTDACAVSDLRVDAKVAVGGENLVTASQSPASGGAAIVYAVHSSLGPLTLGAIYATAIATAVTAAHLSDAQVTVAANADWVVAFVGCNFAVSFASASPWTSLEGSASAVGTGTLATVSDTNRTGSTGPLGPMWNVVGGNFQVVSLAVTDGTVTAPVPTPAWW